MLGFIGVSKCCACSGECLLDLDLVEGTRDVDCGEILRPSQHVQTAVNEGERIIKKIVTQAPIQLSVVDGQAELPILHHHHHWRGPRAGTRTDDAVLEPRLNLLINHLLLGITAST